MYTIQLACNHRELEEIAALSSANLRTIVSEAEKAEQGFITWEYSVQLLKEMHAIAPSIIAKWNDHVVGYALVATHAMSGVHAEMNVMLNNLATLTYEGKPMNDYKYYMMGQICIAKEHRGQGLFDQLYEHHRKMYQDQYDILLTEVSTSNHRSLRAHKRVGFKTIHTYHDHMDEWNVVVWDWRKEK
ncbi:MAG: GNAT family N-acetyltransferase [Sediminibacterium sp.]|jgi:GNAT superfamily N-acetyltransferase